MFLSNFVAIPKQEKILSKPHLLIEQNKIQPDIFMKMHSTHISVTDKNDNGRIIESFLLCSSKQEI